MSDEELEEASDLILKCIVNSQLNNYTKIELLNNIRLFLENYKENIKVLSNYERGRNKK